MYLKKLEIFGFKSFAEKTALTFEPGITAVVGPNGCGKSNVFDAVRWVLGEQSMKELRGSSTQDVIFNGTTKRVALGFAEVSLTFLNEGRVLDTDYDEVTVTRRIFRSGESEYLINKVVVRLKDIQELFMGTGIGAEAYSLIQQGKVDTVVSARPEERRQLLDEASGITKYKAKRKEALSKLKSTDDNLLRVNDIVVEVKRQIASIERQAKKAQLYKEEFEKLKDLEIQLARFQLIGFCVSEDQMKTSREHLQKEEQCFLTKIEEMSQALTTDVDALSLIEQQVGELHTEEVRLDGEIDLSNRQIGFDEERLKNIEESEIKFQDQRKQLELRCVTQRERMEELKQSLLDLEGSMLDKDQQLKLRKKGLEQIEKEIAEAQFEIQDQEKKTEDLTANQTTIRNALTDILKDTEGNKARQKRLEMEEQKIVSEKVAVDLKHEVLIEKLSEAEEKVQNIKEEQIVVIQKLESIQSDVENQETLIINLEKKKLFSQAQGEFVEIFEAQYQNTETSIIENHIVSSLSPQEGCLGIIGKIKSAEVLDDVVMGSLKSKYGLETVDKLYDVVCDMKYVELDQTVLHEKTASLTIEIDEGIQKKESLIQDCDAQKNVCLICDSELQEQLRLLSVLESQKADVLIEVDKLLGELDVVGEENRNVSEVLEVLMMKEEKVSAELDALGFDIGSSLNKAKEKYGEISSKLIEKEDFAVGVSQLDSDITSSREKLLDSHKTQDMLEESLNNSLQEMDQIDEEVAGYIGKKEIYQQEIEEFLLKIETLKVDKESLMLESSQLNEEKSEVLIRVNEQRSSMKVYEKDVEDIRQQFNQLQLNEQKLSFDVQKVKDKLIQSYKIDVDRMTFTDDGADIKDFNEREASENVLKLRKKCDAFGTVNLVAIEEFEELKERFEFLTKQQSDLLEAKSHLMSTINKINRSTKQMFMETFESVSAEFRKYFRKLFGGGEAELIMLDPENVLESGIEIMAQPPGKKLQSISLLSGGERTMTAIALIFGVFKVKPSPFCVLDEIDAALDEANVDRFSDLLKEFADIAQFIVITHNKKTISKADVMYGVTMPETGVSRVVSVKFAEDKKNVNVLESVSR